VWRAADLLRDRPVAVKVLHHEVAATSPVWLSKFRQEARIAVRLSHPNITAVDDFGEYGGQWYLVMEFLEGRSLAQEISDHPEGLPLARVAALGAQVAQGLAAAYEHGIVHRDLKPANVMLLDEDQIKICDFGIAHIADASATHTLSGKAAGTPAFMAPEQWLGNAVDHRTDLYALGGILHTMLIGRPPFPGPSIPALMGQHLNITPTTLRETRPEIPDDLDRLVLELLEKEPGKRPERATDVLARLHHMAGVPAPPQHKRPAFDVRPPFDPPAPPPLLSPPPQGPAVHKTEHRPAGRKPWRTLLLAGMATVTAVAISSAVIIDRADNSKGAESTASGKKTTGSGREINAGANGQATPDSGQPPAESEQNSPKTLKFGATHSYPDGLEVTVGKPKRFVPSATAYGPKAKYYTTFAITVKNGTSKTYSPENLIPALQSTNQQMTRVFDVSLGESPATSLLPGREVTWKIAFAVIDLDDMILEITADSGRRGVIYTS
jgi:serine/threonine protein kinase